QGTAFSLTGPNGISKALNTDTFVLEEATPDDSGSYTFLTTDGCELQLEVTVSAVPSDETDIILYPNPIREGKLNLVLENYMSIPITVGVFNLNGRRVAEFVFPADHLET